MLYLATLLTISAGDTIYINEQLRGQGLAGAIIITLMGVVSMLAFIIGYMYRQANKVYCFRLSERDTLNAALIASTTALKEAIEEQKEQREVIESLAGLITKQGHAFEALAERVRLQYDGLKDDNTRLNSAVVSISTSLPQIVMELRSILQNWRPTVRRRKP